MEHGFHGGRRRTADRQCEWNEGGDDEGGQYGTREFICTGEAGGPDGEQEVLEGARDQRQASRSEDVMTRLATLQSLIA